LILEPLTLEDMEQIRIWRNQVPETLRTPYFLTKEMQEDYYRNIICNRDSRTRYWALIKYEEYDGNAWERIDKHELVYNRNGYRYLLGYGGIENISWENRNGEISILIDPERWRQHLGIEAVGLFLDQAFNKLNLFTVYGECYYCGPWKFWEKMVESRGELATSTYLPARKYWNGKYYGSYYFTFYRSENCECDMCHPGKEDEQEATREKQQAVLW
jgi:RimJ/RimL family protein N-acetyltransferase